MRLLGTKKTAPDSNPKSSENGVVVLRRLFKRAPRTPGRPWGFFFSSVQATRARRRLVVRFCRVGVLGAGVDESGLLDCSHEDESLTARDSKKLGHLGRSGFSGSWRSEFSA